MSQNFLKLNDDKSESASQEAWHTEEKHLRLIHFKSLRSDHSRLPLDLHKVTHALIFSQLDYCNTLHAGISQSSLHRLPTGAERCCTISAVLANLHFPFYFILILNEGQNNIISFP